MWELVEFVTILKFFNGKVYSARLSFLDKHVELVIFVNPAHFLGLLIPSTGCSQHAVLPWGNGRASHLAVRLTNQFSVNLSWHTGSACHISLLLIGYFSLCLQLLKLNDISDFLIRYLSVTYTGILEDSWPGVLCRPTLIYYYRSFRTLDCVLLSTIP